MIDAVTAKHNPPHQAEASRPHSANWLSRAVTRIADSACCRLMSQALSCHSTRQFLMVSTLSLGGAAIGMIKAPNDDASIILGFYIGYMTGLLGCSCYNFYHSVVKPSLEVAPESSAYGKYRI